MPPVDLKKIARDNPHLDIAQIEKSCEARKERNVEGRGYNLATPAERRRAIVGHRPGKDPRTVRLRVSLHFNNATNSSNSQT
jgi:hypothetical protein